ncbi:MAG: Holliday junction resolvase RuvX [Calditrichaeota bacterium]|nr:Holliday junction resolvase RuvX [Calditrichota bacterium]
MSEHGTPESGLPPFPEGCRVMGLDYGTVRIGVALSDSELCTASPFETLGAGRGLLPRLRELIVGQRVALVVMGLPERNDGAPGTLDTQIRHLASVLTREGYPVVFQNEAFSSVRAQQQLEQAGRPARERRGRHQATDRVAAALLLQDWLDAHPELRSGRR